MRVTSVFWRNLQAYNDGYRLIVNKGSSRSSKTVSIIQVLDRIGALSADHRKISIVSQSYPHLREGAIYEYEKYMMRENIHRVHKESRHVIEVGNSVINYFALGDSKEKAKAIGPGRDILYLNEPNKGISWQDYVDLQIRTSECIFLDYNPSAPFWLQKQGLLDSPRTIVIHSTWRDNIDNLTDAQIEEFREAYRKSKFDPFWNYWWKVYGEGEDAVMVEERIMPVIQRASKVPDDAIEIPSGLDFGFFPDPTAFARLWIVPRKQTGKLKDDLYIQQLVYSTRLSINARGEGINNLVDILEEKGFNKRHLIIADSANPLAISEMRSAGFNIEAIKKTSVETSIRLFHDYNIYILDGSEDIYEEFDNYKYARDKSTGEILGVPEKGQRDHGIDLCRYILMSRNSRWSV